MSAKPPRSQTISIAGPVGQLEAIVEVPAEALPLGAVVVCHPHPQYGGTMHNKVAHTLARSFVRLGYAALRFNFRGTEGSEGDYDEGVGEVDDALAALHWARQQYPNVPIWLAGFSFGAAVALKAAVAEAVDGLITVAPAVSRFANGLETQPQCPWLVVQGDQDEIVPVDEVIEWLDQLEPGPELVVMPGVGHFFHGNLVELRQTLVANLESKNKAEPDDAG